MRVANRIQPMCARADKKLVLVGQPKRVINQVKNLITAQDMQNELMRLVLAV
jgi:hypothetical protein